MKSSEPRAEAPRVAVFAKAPVPGTVKTRLAGLLGERRKGQPERDDAEHEPFPELHATPLNSVSTVYPDQPLGIN